MKTYTYKGVRLEAKRGDITKAQVDVIVNAANGTLLGGGGVDGAIHRAAGPSLLEQCQAIRARRGTLEPGEAELTGAGELLAKHVIHAVGPRWNGGTYGEQVQLERAYRASLELAQANKLTSIAFPAISTGIYQFPFDRASYIALRTAFLFLDETPEPTLELISFYLFSEQDFERFGDIMDEICKTMTGL